MCEFVFIFVFYLFDMAMQHICAGFDLILLSLFLRFVFVLNLYVPILLFVFVWQGGKSAKDFQEFWLRPIK